MVELKGGTLVAYQGGSNRFNRSMVELKVDTLTEYRSTTTAIQSIYGRIERVQESSGREIGRDSIDLW